MSSKMKISLEYPNIEALKKDISIVFTTDLLCRLNFTLKGIALAVEFFVLTWNILKRHTSPVIVATSLLSAGIMMRSSTKRTKKILMKTFEISLSSMQACLYDVLREQNIPITYEWAELPKIIPIYGRRLLCSECQSGNHEIK